MWRLGQSFVRQPADKCPYRLWYEERKAYEIENNEAGNYADQAVAILQRLPNHAQAAIYREGKLPPAHIDRRARRWVEKRFLSHWHEVAYIEHYGEPPPKPYVIEHGGHAEIVGPPNYP